MKKGYIPSFFALINLLKNSYTQYTIPVLKIRFLLRIDEGRKRWYFGIVVRWYDQITIFLRANLRNFES